MNTPKQVVEHRPTETITGLALATAVYGFLTQAGMDTVASAMIGVALAFIPGTISAVVDALRGRP